MKVSVIVPCYNQAHFLPDALESCLAQTVHEREIIVVDDGSTDHTAQVVSRFGQIRYVYQSNHGPSAARNTGLQRARGKFIQFLDADDLLRPQKLERSLAVFAAQPQLGVVYTDFEVRTSDLRESVAGGPARGTSVLKPEAALLQQLLSRPTTYFAPHCALIRRQPLLDVGGFNETLRLAEDWFLWISLAARGVLFGYLDEVLVWYREHPNSLSSRALPMAAARLSAYQALREQALPPGVIDLNRAIAGRHHALAIALWRRSRRAEARAQFSRALQLNRGLQPYRRLLRLLTYVAPAERALRLLETVERFRQP